MPHALPSFTDPYGMAHWAYPRAAKIRTKQSGMSASPWRVFDELIDVSAHVPAYRILETEGSRTLAAKITRAPSLKPFSAKTPLGKRLVEIRQRAIAHGLRLLTEEEIEIEIERRRGDIAE